MCSSDLNDVYVIKVSEDSPYVSRVTDKNKELLLPAIRDCIRKVDGEKRTMQVYLMPGLLGEETER